MRKAFATGWAVASSVFTVLGLINLFDLIEWIENLSASLQWIVGWWRYFSAYMFYIIGINISEIAQTIILLIAIATSSASIYSFMLHRQSAFGFILRRGWKREIAQPRPLGRNGPEEYQPRFIDEENLDALIAGVGGMVMAVIFLSEEYPIIGKAVIFSSIFSITMAMLGRTEFFHSILTLSRDNRRVITRIFIALFIFIPSIPFLLLFLIPAAVAPFKKAVFWTVGAVALLLAGNWAAINFVDPLLLPLLKNLPEAPEAPFPERRTALPAIGDHRPHE